MSEQETTSTIEPSAGGDGEALAIRGSARRLIRRVLEGKLKTAVGGEYDRARKELARYAHDPKTSPSEKRKALQALLGDEAVGVTAAAAALRDGQEGTAPPPLPPGSVPVGALPIEALARLASSEEAHAALVALARRALVQPVVDVTPESVVTTNGHARNGAA